MKTRISAPPTSAPSDRADVSNPCQAPWWRYEAAAKAALEGRVLGPTVYDADTRILADYLALERAWADDARVARLAGWRPHAHRALNIWRDPYRTIAAKLEAQLLTPRSARAIGTLMQLPIRTVELYESWFFSIGLRINDLAYVLEHAIAGEFRRGLAPAAAERFATQKFLAYISGPDALDCLLLGADPSEPGEAYLKAGEVAQSAMGFKNLETLVKFLVAESSECPRSTRDQEQFRSKLLEQIAASRLGATGTHMLSPMQGSAWLRSPRQPTTRRAASAGSAPQVPPVEPDPQASAMLEAVRRLGAQYVLATPQPRRAHRESGCFLGPPDAQEAAAQLRDQFSDEALVAAGVCVAGEGEEPVLAPELTGHPLVLLRTAEDGPPAAIITARGPIPNQQPASVVLDDASTRALLGNSQHLLFLVPPAEFAPYRAVGLPACPWPRSTGTCRQHDVTRLQEKVLHLGQPAVGRGHVDGGALDSQQGEDVGSGPEAQPDAAAESRPDGPLDVREPPMLVLAGWGVAGPGEETQREFREAVEYFAELHHVCPSRSIRIGVWLPSVPQQAAMTAALRFGGLRSFYRAASDSFGSNLFTLSRALEVNLMAPTLPGNLIEARRFVDAAIDYLGMNSPEVAHRYRSYLALLAKTFPGHAALAASNPVQAALEGSIEDETKAILGQSPLYCAESAAHMIDPWRDRGRLDALERDRDRRLKRLLQLARAHANHDFLARRFSQNDRPGLTR